jgi:hypothetical protein
MRWTFSKSLLDSASTRPQFNQHTLRTQEQLITQATEERRPPALPTSTEQALLRALTQLRALALHSRPTRHLASVALGTVTFTRMAPTALPCSLSSQGSRTSSAQPSSTSRSSLKRPFKAPRTVTTSCFLARTSLPPERSAQGSALMSVTAESAERRAI